MCAACAAPCGACMQSRHSRHRIRGSAPPAAYVQRVSRADSFVVCSARALCAALHGDAACRMPLASRARHPSTGSAASGAGAVALLGAVGAPMARPLREPLRQAVGAPLATAKHFPAQACLLGLAGTEAHVCAGTAGLRERAAAALGRAAAQVRHGGWCALSASRVAADAVPRAMLCVVRCLHCRAEHAEGPLRSWDAVAHLRALRCGARSAVGRAAHGLRAPAACPAACPDCAALVISSATLRCAAGTCRPFAHASAETASTRRSAPRPQTPTARSGWRPLRRPPRGRRLRRTTRSRWWARRLYCTVSRRAASTARCG